MTVRTITSFWHPRLKVSRADRPALVKGWSHHHDVFPEFVEAPLRESDQFGGSAEVDRSSIILVSAPGAVGKSTLAREIAARTGAIYVDLAKADPVGGNTLSGGLAKSRVYADWEENNIALLIDGLDEARLRVTQESYAAFFADIAEICGHRSVPTVLFGRTGAVEDAWLILSEHNVDAPVLEIGYYGPDAAIDFAELRLRHLRAKDGQIDHNESDKIAVRLLLEKLRNLTERGLSDENFAGYAPVLQAVADRVNVEKNPSALISSIEKGAQPITLQTVVNSILIRERGKLHGLQFSDPSLAETLYSPREQLDRLTAIVYNLPFPSIPAMSADDARIYSSALESWVVEHPFLKGLNKPSSIVFDAAIIAHALKNFETTASVVEQQLSKGMAANPFLTEFYIGEPSDDPELKIPPEHIGIIYSSIRSRLSLGDKASLTIDGPDDEDCNDISVEVEILLGRKDADRPKTLKLSTHFQGLIRLGPHLENVSIFAPKSNVEIGFGSEVVLTAPIDIQCANLRLIAPRVTIESLPDRLDSTVFLEADAAEGTQIAAMPQVRGGALFRASWPGVRTHPWITFAASPSLSSDPAIDEAMRRFRKFVIAFRSHSKGSLRRLGAKLEHARMTKGAGRAVLELMKKEGIITIHDKMYELNPDILGEKTAATYRQCMMREFHETTYKFVERALK